MERKRLLFIVNVFTPDQCGGAVLFEDLCQGFHEQGMEVTVRCAYPYYPEWKDKSGQNGWQIHKESLPAYHLERYGLYIPQNPNSIWQRMLYEGSFFLSLLRSLRKTKHFDAVMVVCPLMGAVAFASVVRWVYRIPIWLNVQDLSADAATKSGLSTSKVLNKLMARIQSFLFNQTQIWSSVSPVMVARLKELNRKKQPVLYTPNWVHKSVFQRIKALPSKDGKLPQKTIKLLYSGNIGKKQDLLRFCKYLQQTSHDFFFKIQGDGSESKQISRWIASVNDPRFSFGSLLEEAEYVRNLYEADLFVITEKSGVGESFIPSKMIPSLAMGTPILAVSDAESPFGKEMTFSKAGMWFNWNNLDKIDDLFERLGQSPDLIQIWQAHALKRAKFYQRETILDLYTQGLESMMYQGVAKLQA